tara:strand:- start:1266 stop:1784 length:519 start_codon:yes stop_codon:yes gene_type:complete
MIEINFNKEEIDACRKGAKLRYQFARNSDLENENYASDPERQEGSALDYLGIRGELAVAKAFDLHFDPFRGMGVDNGIDFFWNEISIDVKSTVWITGKLMFKSVEKFKSDIAVLAIELEEDFFRVPGWIKREDFVKNSGPFLNGVAVTQEDLNPPQELWQIMTNKKNQKYER